MSDENTNPNPENEPTPKPTEKGAKDAEMQDGEGTFYAFQPEPKTRREEDAEKN